MESLTGEIFGGKPVYTKLLDVGQLPNNTTKTIPTGITNPYYVWIDPSNSLCFNNAAGYPFPYVEPGNVNGSVSGRLHSFFTVLEVNSKTDWSNYAALVAIKYTKA